MKRVSSAGVPASRPRRRLIGKQPYFRDSDVPASKGPLESVGAGTAFECSKSTKLNLPADIGASEVVLDSRCNTQVSTSTAASLSPNQNRMSDAACGSQTGDAASSASACGSVDPAESNAGMPSTRASAEATSTPAGEAYSVTGRDDPLQDLSNIRTIRTLHELKQRWNLLDFCDDCPLADNSERSDMLRHMAKVVKKGSSSYMNPFGGDDTEYFLDAFTSLPKPEQVAFFKAAQACTQKARNQVIGISAEEGIWEFTAIGERLTDDDLRRVLLTPGCPPFCVDPQHGRNSWKGSERQPVASVEKARELVEAYLHRNPRANVNGEVVVKMRCCAPQCSFLKCGAAGCTRNICKDHGTGDGYWEDDIPGPDVEFCVVKCWEQNCGTAYCNRHRNLMLHCDVCRNGAMAQCSMIGEGRAGEHFYCSNCLTRCCRRIGASQSEDDGLSQDSEAAEDEICGFLCCPSCYDDHRCGDNPCDYV